MSKKKKHQKQLNKAQAQQEVPEKRAFRVPETTMTFDDAFSDALKKMLEAPDQTEQRKQENFVSLPILELPPRKSGSNGKEHREQSAEKADIDGGVENALTAFLPQEEPETQPESMFREQIDSAAPVQSQQERPVSEDAIRTELLRTFSESPLTRMENASYNAVSADDWTDSQSFEEPAAFEEEPYFEEPAAPEEEPYFEEPAAPEEEPYFEEPAAFEEEPYFEEPAAPEEEPYFEEPAVSEEPAAPAPELHFEESKIAPAFPQTGWMPAQAQPLELTESPARSDAEKQKAPSGFFMDPRLLEKPKTSEAPEIYMLQPSEGEELPETPETFVVPDIREETAEHAPEVFKVPDLPDHSDILAAPETFEVPETLHFEPLQEQSTISFAPVEEATPYSEKERIQKEDTASLLSVVQSLLGTDEPVKEYQQARWDESAQKPDVPVKQDTVRFTPVSEKRREQEARTDEPEVHTEAAQAVTAEPDNLNTFWKEFDELKGMLGTEEPARPEEIPAEHAQTETLPAQDEIKSEPADEAPAASAPEEMTQTEAGKEGLTSGADEGSGRKHTVFGMFRKRRTQISERLQQAKEQSNLPQPTVPEEPETPAAEFYEAPAPIVPEEPETPAAEFYEEPAPTVPEEPETPAAEFYEEPAPTVPEEPETPAAEYRDDFDLPAASDVFEKKATETEPKAESEQKKLFDKLSELLDAPVVIQSASVKETVPEAPAEQPETEVFVTPAVKPKPAEPRRKTGAARTQAAHRISDATQRIPALPKETVAEPAADLRPEEAYRACSKKLGATRTRLAIAAVVTLFSVLLTVYSSAGWNFLPKSVDVTVAAYILLALLLVAAAAAYDVFADALKDLSKLKMTVPILVAAAAVIVAADTVQAASADRVPFCAAACVLIFLLLWDRYDGINGILTSLRVLRDAKEPTGIVEVHDVMKGRVGLFRASGSVEDFMDKLEKEPPTKSMMQFYVPAVIIFSTVAAVIISAKSDSPFLWTASLLLLGSIPLLGILNFNRLFSILSKRLSDSDAALCGWYGAETFGGDHSILVGDRDLFPERNIKLNGIKMITNDADRVIGYAAATAKAAESVLYPLFEEELCSRNARHYRVECFRFYESGGLGAEISGDIVLMGTLDFMKRMGVHMENGMKLKQAVYTSVNGELAAVFAIKYTPKDSVRRGLAAIAENRHFRTIFVTRDFLMTPEMIRDKYEISLTNTLYPTAKERMRLSEAELKEKGKQGALLIDDSFGSFADAAAGGRVLRSAVTTAVALTLLNGLIGFVLMAVLSFRQGFEAATAVNLLLYQLIWLIPTLFLTGWTRRY